MNLGVPELVLILAVVLIVFGAGRIPEIGAAIPKAARNFKRAASGEEIEEEPAPRATPSHSASRPAPRSTPVSQRTKRGRFRGLGMLAFGVALICIYLEFEVLHLGLPLQVTIGVFAALGALLWVL